MKTLLKLTAIAVVFGFAILTAGVALDRAVSDPDYRPHATLALNRMSMSSGVLRDIAPYAESGGLSGAFVSQAVATIDEALAHLESIQPSFLDTDAWSVHQHFRVQFKECRALLNRMDEDTSEYYYVDDLVLLGELCDPMPPTEHTSATPAGGASVPLIDQ